MSEVCVSSSLLAQASRLGAGAPAWVLGRGNYLSALVRSEELSRASHDSLKHHTAVGIPVIGAAVFEGDVSAAASRLGASKVSGLSYLLLIEGNDVRVFHLGDGGPQETKYITVEDSEAHISEELGLICVRTTLEVPCHVAGDRSGVRAAVEAIKASLAAMEGVAFRVQEAEGPGRMVVPSQLGPTDTVSALGDNTVKEKPAGKKGKGAPTKKSSTKVTRSGPAHMEVLFRAGGAADTGAAMSLACSSVAPGDYISKLSLNVASYHRGNEPLTDALAAIAAALSAQADELCGLLLDSGAEARCRPGAYHFAPMGLPTPITICYPLDTAQKDEKHLSAIRKEWHERLGLPLNCPFLVTTGALEVHPTLNPAGRIRNVHIGLPPSGVQNGVLHMVQGSYDYYHYMQDRFDDNGWGCAYRSLQTLISWYIAQNYKKVKVPDHREIQKMLVDMGDKEKKFIGSKKWIGAFEVSLCMDNVLDAPCKILNVNSGSEVEGKAREFAKHFDTHGTPIMIGGGVLAYTMLGIDYNEATGEVMFLILDPHYTGGEDVKIIHDKGWCGWKGPELFRSDAFYNFCCPQRLNMY